MNSQSKTNVIEPQRAEPLSVVSHAVEQYLSDTLGLRGYLQDMTNLSDLTQSKQVTKKMVSISVYVQDLNSYNSDERELLQKMLMAMKIETAKIAVHDLKDFNPNHVQSILFFQMVDVVTHPEDQTYSSRMLIKNPKLKNEAWTFLQKVMKQYQSLS